MRSKALIFFLFVVLLSCSNDDKNVYSDDSKVNNWVLENRREFSDITLEEIASYQGEEQRAIFRLIDSENRKGIWLSKANILIKKYPNQSIIFNEFLDFVEEYDFESNLSTDQVRFFDEIIEKGRNDYNWDDEFIGITFCSFEYYSADHNYNIFSRTLLTNADDEPTCNCKWGGMFACGSMDCNSGCEDDGKKGCGFLFMQTCTGVCK